MPALVLSGGTILTVNADDELIAAADLRVEGSRIAALGPAGTLAAPGDTVIDCRDTLITPGQMRSQWRDRMSGLRRSSVQPGERIASSGGGA